MGYWPLNLEAFFLIANNLELFFLTGPPFQEPLEVPHLEIEDAIGAPLGVHVALLDAADRENFFALDEELALIWVVAGPIQHELGQHAPAPERHDLVEHLVSLGLHFHILQARQPPHQDHCQSGPHLWVLCY